MKKNKKVLKIISLVILFTIIILLGNSKLTVKNTSYQKFIANNKEYQASDVDEEAIVEQNMLYAYDQLDDKMNEHEKSLILAMYTQEGSVYDDSNYASKQTYQSVFLNHNSVCAGFNDTFRVLNQRAGLSCEMVTSVKGNHAWGLCNLDDEWTYIDVTKAYTNRNYPTPYADMSFPLLFYSRNNIAQSTLYNFTDARLKFNELFNLPNAATFPIGTSSSGDLYPYTSRVYYDDTYKYYLSDTYNSKVYENPWTTALYKENRETKVKEKLADVLYNMRYETGLVKDNNYLYYVGLDENLYRMDATTKTTSKVASSTSTGTVANVFVQDGYIKYSLYDETNKTTQVNTLKELETWPTIKTYTFNDNNHNYNLEYVEGTRGVSILRAVSKNDEVPSGTLTLPDMINNKKVIGIAGEAFYETSFEGKIVLPKYLEYIGFRAFYFSTKFSGSLELPSTLKSIGNEAFYMVPIDGELNIPDSVTYIGYDAFRECHIQSLKLGKGLKYLADSVFAWNRELDGVVEIPEGVEYLGSSLFRYCFKLKAVIIPSTVKEISSNFISKDDALEEIIIESKDLDYIGIANETSATIYLHNNTKTSDLADSNGLIYQDLVQKVTFNTKEYSGNVGDTINLDYTLTPKYYYSSSDLKWESNNQQVATVSDGKVRLLKEGEAEITVTTKTGNKETCKVKVNDIRLTLNYYQYQLDTINDKIQLKATLTDGTSPKVTWESGNNEIATVDSYGNVTPKSSGFVYIYVSYNSMKNYCLVFVNLPVTLSDGRKGFLGDLNRDGLMNSIDSGIISDLYNNKNATPDDILLADLNRDGSINISDSLIIIDAYINNYFHTGVYKSIEEVTLNKNNLTMKIGDITNLEATINPEDTTDSPKLTWKSSNPSVAIVEDGKITAKGDGRTTITVETSNNKKTTCEVIVGTGISKFLKGDLDEDSVITVDDAVEALYYYIEKYEITPHKLEIGDMDNDGKITVDDAVDILMLYVNK